MSKYKTNNFLSASIFQILFIKYFVFIIIILCWVTVLHGDITDYSRSVITERPDDPSAVYLTKEIFDVADDGVKDATEDIQRAIDLVESNSGKGIVFVPEGTYRITKKIYLWSGIRLIGYGQNRPKFILRENTPGFQSGSGRYMIHFVYNKPQYQNEDIPDGNWSTHYSEINNIDFEICKGNPAAIAIRFNVAQGSNLKNIDFNIGSGLCAVEEMGNIIERCSFQGGRWGIKTGSSPAGWQCSVLDCNFENQREASVITDNAGMTIIRSRISNVPIGISVPGYEKLYVKDTYFENIEKTAIAMNSYTSLIVNLENIVCTNVPEYMQFSGRIQGAAKGEYRMNYEAPGENYKINSFSHGLYIALMTDTKEYLRDFTTVSDTEILKNPDILNVKSDTLLPDSSLWTNILDFGAKPDGVSDSTDAIERAIASNDNIYFPMGDYLISRTIRLRENNRFIGLHPMKTHFILADLAAGFADPSQAKALIETSYGGSNSISGIGIKLGDHPGAIGVKWTANIDSFMDDMRFIGKEGKQSKSIWVTDNGGGIFKNMWIVEWGTSLPFHISDTSTQGSIYQISIEHHKMNEVVLERVNNWSFFCLQTEEFKGNENTLPIYLIDCKNIEFANLICYRTTGVFEPFHTAVKLKSSDNLIFKGVWMRSGGPFPFDYAIFDENSGIQVPHLQFSRMDINICK